MTTRELRACPGPGPSPDPAGFGPGPGSEGVFFLGPGLKDFFFLGLGPGPGSAFFLVRPGSVFFFQSSPVCILLLI